MLTASGHTQHKQVFFKTNQVFLSLLRIWMSCFSQEIKVQTSRRMDIQPHNAKSRLRMESNQKSPDTQGKWNAAPKAKGRLLGRGQPAWPHALPPLPKTPAHALTPPPKRPQIKIASFFPLRGQIWVLTPTSSSGCLLITVNLFPCHKLGVSGFFFIGPTMWQVNEPVFGFSNNTLWQEIQGTSGKPGSCNCPTENQALWKKSAVLSYY